MGIFLQATLSPAEKATYDVAKSRQRYVLLVLACFQSALSAALVFGWASLLLILEDEASFLNFFCQLFLICFLYRKFILVFVQKVKLYLVPLKKTIWAMCLRKALPFGLLLTFPAA